MRLLLVEDDKKLSVFMVKGLRQAGFAVDHSDNGHDGLHLALTETYDAAIMDIMLPEIDGLTIIEKMRGHGIRTPVIILSAKGASRQLIESAQCGIGVEPEQPEALAEAILKLYQDRPLGERLGRHGRRFVSAHMDRMKFAIRYERILEQVAQSNRCLLPS